MGLISINNLLDTEESNHSILKDGCGILGIFNLEEAVTDAYYALQDLQHRGQESAGIAFKIKTENGYRLKVIKGLGLVTDVFRNVNLDKFKDVKTVVGQVRYSTTGGTNIANAQPLVRTIKIGDKKYDLAITHNGNITNYEYLKRKFSDYKFKTTVDSEVLFPLLNNSKADTLEEVVIDALKHLRGSYCFNLLFLDKQTGEETIIAARDPHGFRPLVIGKKNKAYIVSSESCAIGKKGVSGMEGDYICDVNPGEIVVFRKNTEPKPIQFAKPDYHYCDFCKIYFSRPDSILQNPRTTLDKIVKNPDDDEKMPLPTYHTLRQKLGSQLYSEILKKELQFKADVVVPFQYSGIDPAIGFHNVSGIRYDSAILRNLYIPRTFIMGRKYERERAVSRKHSPIPDALDGLEVLLVDDSIVTGNTTKKRVQAVKNAGTKKVYVGIASPPIIEECDKGVDTKRRTLIARKFLNEVGYTPKQFYLYQEVRDQVIEKIREYIGADKLYFLSFEGMRECFPKNIGYCGQCLTGIDPLKSNH